MVLFAAGRRVEDDEQLEELRSCATTRYVTPLAMAQILVARGDDSEALTKRIGLPAVAACVIS